MTGTLKARVNGSWVPVAGSGQDAANTARWNTAWGVLGSVSARTDIVCSASQNVAVVAFTAIAGRRYKASYECVGIMTSANNTLQHRLHLDAGTVLIAESRLTSTPMAGGQQMSVVMIADDFTTTPGSHTVEAYFAVPGGYWTVQGSWNPWRLVVADVGPVTPASIAPPEAGPRVVASGNSLGVVAVGALTNQAGQSLAQAAWANLSQPLYVTLSAGRRYRVSFAARAVQANGSANVLYRLSDNGTPWGERHQIYAGQYLHLADTWLMNGDGALHQLYVQVICNTSPLTVYTEMNAGASEFYVEDIGPSTSPALPLPDVFSAFTPVASFENGFSNFGNARTPTCYRKVGDIVEMRVAVKSGTGNGASIFTLPAGFRPPGTLDFVGRDNAGQCVFNLMTTGQVLWYGQTANNAIVALNCSFSITA